MNFTVKPYAYVSGQGAHILSESGTRIVATVNGTSYPIGSACAEDVALARIMAAAPELLDAATAMVNELDSQGDFENWERCKAQLRAAVAQANGEPV